MKQLRVVLLPPGWDASLFAGLPPAVCCWYPFYTPGWRKTMWGKESCLRKQHDGRNWALNHQPSDLKSNVLTTTPPRPHKCIISLLILLSALQASLKLDYSWVTFHLHWLMVPLSWNLDDVYVRKESERQKERRQEEKEDLWLPACQLEFHGWDT